LRVAEAAADAAGGLVGSNPSGLHVLEQLGVVRADGRCVLHGSG